MAGIRKKKEILDQLLRQEIVEVILKMIHSNTAITMDEVARQCGVSKGTLYNYFQNKEELLDHVHHVVLEPLRESHQQIFNSHTEPLKKLHDFIESVFAIHECIANYFRFVWQNKTAEVVYSERVDMLMHPLAKICQEGIEKGEFINVDSYILAEMVYGTAIGTLTTLNYRDQSNIDREKILQDVKTLINKIIC